ncbi:MAG: cytochrome P450 [Gammaproteobacteria bacterium]|nr:cytochrome P450 [Gammaproteobacteria bacterium]
MNETAEKSQIARLALSDPATFQDQDGVHGIFAELRRSDPVAWCPEPHGGPGFWAVTTYDDIQYVSKHPQLFSSDRQLGGITLESPEMRARREGRERRTEPGEAGIFEAGSSMITMDPPRHTKHRRMVAPGFSPQRLDGLIPRIRERCTEILDRIEGRGECEFVREVAAELPIQMLAELFGVAQEDRHRLFEWSNIIIGGDDPDMQVDRKDLTSTFTELFGYAMALREARQKEPGDDLISMLVHTEIEGKPMEVADYISAFVLLVVAGNETTRNSISGGILALSRHPEQKRKLIDDPSLIPGAVDEIIRWVAPVVYMRRTALEDTELGGKKIAKGDKLSLWYMSGNRDESKWDDPGVFDVTREGPRHLSFGYGQHLCIGWRLAEIQLTVCLEEVLKRFGDFEVVGQVDRMRSNFLNSIKRMQVTYSA